jgi:hypothetical protein
MTSVEVTEQQQRSVGRIGIRSCSTDGLGQQLPLSVVFRRAVKGTDQHLTTKRRNNNAGVDSLRRRGRRLMPS